MDIQELKDMSREDKVLCLYEHGAVGSLRKYPEETLNDMMVGIYPECAELYVEMQ